MHTWKLMHTKFARFNKIFVFFPKMIKFQIAFCIAIMIDWATTFYAFLTSKVPIKVKYLVEKKKGIGYDTLLIQLYKSVLLKLIV